MITALKLEKLQANEQDQQSTSNCGSDVLTSPLAEPPSVRFLSCFDSKVFYVDIFNLINATVSHFLKARDNNNCMLANLSKVSCCIVD